MLLMLAFFFENLLSEENCPGQEHQMEQHLKAACHSNTMLKKHQQEMLMMIVFDKNRELDKLDST